MHPMLPGLLGESCFVSRSIDREFKHTLIAFRRTIMRRIPKIIPPLSRVRLVRTDKRTPTWRKDVGRQFRVGYYSRKDELDCIWLVNENGKYEQTTDRDFLVKY